MDTDLRLVSNPGMCLKSSNEEKTTCLLGKTEIVDLQYMKCSEVHTNIT